MRTLSKLTDWRKNDSLKKSSARRSRLFRRQISASEKVIARALEILMQPIKGCAPDDSAKLFSVGTAMASTALGLHSPLVQIAQPRIIFKQATWKPDVGSPARPFNEYMHYLDKWRDRMKSLGNGETQDT